MVFIFIIDQRPVSRSKFNLVWLSSGELASLILTLAVLDIWYHEAGYQI